jgi:hypothetical protein
MAKAKNRIEWRLSVPETDPLCERIQTYVAGLRVAPTTAQLMRYLIGRGIDAELNETRRN